MTPIETTRAVAGPVGKLGGAWMFDGGVAARGVELGLGVWPWYHCGRGGVLGSEIDPSVVVAAFGFFPPELQAKAWRKGASLFPPREITGHYAQACLVFSRERFAGAPAGLADLLRTATDSADVMGVPVFAGWRALQHELDPQDEPAKLGLALQVAREHRGGNHLLAVAAAGVTPLQAVMSGRYGAGNAEFFGWPRPWPDPESGREAMAGAEALTDALVAPAFGVLDDHTRAELAAGLRAL